VISTKMSTKLQENSRPPQLEQMSSEPTGVPVAEGLMSEFSTSTLPPDHFKRICEDVAQGIAKVLLRDVHQVVADIRRQYKDHNQLLARQEMALQNLMGRVGSIPVSSTTNQESKTGFACGLCMNDVGSLGVESQRDNSSSEIYMVRGSPRRTEGAVQPRAEVTMVDQRHWSGQGGKESQQVRRPRKTAQEVQQWVAKQLAEKMAPMSPRPSPPPPPPHPCPHREEVSEYNNGSEYLPAERPDPADQIPETEIAAVGEMSPDSNNRASRSSGTSNNLPLRQSRGDDDDNYILRQSEFGIPVARRDNECDAPRDGAFSEHLHKQQHGEKAPRVSKGGGGHDKLFGDMGLDKTQLDKEEYNVAQFYFDTGIAQAIARSDLFSHITLVVIFCNAIYIGYDADQNFEENLLDAKIQFQVLEYLFCIFFTLEWLVRFLAFRYKRDCLKDMWFKFDTVLVAQMVVETWIFPVALSGGTGIPSGLIKLVRLLRLARMARLMRAFPELLAMIKGVKVASRAVGSALVMLIGLIYVFAIIMFTLLKDVTDEQVSSRFRRLGLTMTTLLIDGTFLDGFGYVARSLMDTNHYFPLCVLILFVLLSALTVMNMLIGVLCEVVSAVAAAEKEDSAIRLVKDKLLALLRELDEDGSGEISRQEIQQVLDNEDAMAVLENLQVDVHHLMEQLDMFFEEGGDLTIQQIMDLILMLRGDRPITMKDSLHFLTFSRWKELKTFDEVKKMIMILTASLEIPDTIEITPFEFRHGSSEFT